MLDLTLLSVCFSENLRYRFSCYRPLVGSIIGSLITAVFVPKRQYDYWRRQQYVELCLNVIQKLQQLTDEYTSLFAGGGRPDQQFGLRQLYLRLHQ
jgi:hypothetical protein